MLIELKLFHVPVHVHVKREVKNVVLLKFKQNFKRMDEHVEWNAILSIHKSMTYGMSQGFSIKDGIVKCLNPVSIVLIRAYVTDEHKVIVPATAISNIYFQHKNFRIRSNESSYIQFSRLAKQFIGKIEATLLTAYLINMIF